MYVCEKLASGLMIMAQSTKSLQARYASAWVSQISRLQPKDIPEEYQERFAALRRDLERVQDEDRGSIVASAEQMTNQYIEHAIDQLFCIYASVSERRSG